MSYGTYEFVEDITSQLALNDAAARADDEYVEDIRLQSCVISARIDDLQQCRTLLRDAYVAGCFNATPLLRDRINAALQLADRSHADILVALGEYEPEEVDQ